MDKKLSILILSLIFFSFAASGFHFEERSIGGHDYFSSLDDPREIMTEFVAPFLLIAVLFQRGYEKALSFSFADDQDNFRGPFNQDQERDKVKRYSLIMALATSAMIVPTPWFRLIRYWVANLFSLIGVLFFGAIFVAFVWLLWKAFS